MATYHVEVQAPGRTGRPSGTAAVPRTVTLAARPPQPVVRPWTPAPALAERHDHPAAWTGAPALTHELSRALSRRSPEAGRPGEPDEVAAERVADRVTGAGWSDIGSGERPPVATGGFSALRTARDASTAPLEPAGPARFLVADAVAGRGEPLPVTVRPQLERSLGAAFSRVRVHDDETAAEAAAAVGARAFTLGEHVVFGRGEYEPRTASGVHLLVHELVHVLQGRAGGPPGLRRQTDPRHARGYAGEQAMGFTLYRYEDGWAAIRGPSGAAGHGVTSSGEDGLFYNVRTGQLHIVDNKSLARRGNVGSATAIDPSRNLGNNVEEMISAVEGFSVRDLPMRQHVLRLLRQTRAALRDGLPLPGRVSLVVTNAGGRSTGVTARLRRLGVVFRDVAAPTSPPGTARPSLRGGPRTGPFGARLRARARGVAGALALLALAIGVERLRAQQQQQREQAAVARDFDAVVAPALEEFVAQRADVVASRSESIALAVARGDPEAGCLYLSYRYRLLRRTGITVIPLGLQGADVEEFDDYHGIEFDSAELSASPVSGERVLPSRSAGLGAVIEPTEIRASTSLYGPGQAIDEQLRLLEGVLVLRDDVASRDDLASGEEGGGRKAPGAGATAALPGALGEAREALRRGERAAFFDALDRARAALQERLATDADTRLADVEEELAEITAVSARLPQLQCTGSP